MEFIIFWDGYIFRKEDIRSDEIGVLDYYESDRIRWSCYLGKVRWKVSMGVGLLYKRIER